MLARLASRGVLVLTLRVRTAQYFCMHGENCGGLIWEAIILALMVIA
jgi:hypothetical protein